jgi:hypothetical protein
MSAVARYLSGLPPIAEVRLAVYVSVSPRNVSEHGVLHGDKRLSQNPELAVFVHIDPWKFPAPERR